MIAFLGALLSLPAIEVQEVLRADADSVVVCLTIPLPEGADKTELACANLLGDAVLAGTEAYTRQELFRFGTQSHTSPHVYANGRCIQYIAEAPAGKDGLELAVDIIVQLWQHPALDPQDLARVLEKWKGRGFETLDFSANLVDQPTLRRFASMVAEAIPSNLTVSGKFPPHEPSNTFGEKWSSSKVSSKTMWISKSSRTASQSFQVSGAPVSTKSEFASNLLAACMLGSGKTSSLFRIVRQQMRKSYEQQSILWPVRDGFQVRLYAKTTAENSQAILEALREDVSQWDENSLATAKNIAVASLEGRFPQSPIWLDLRGPMGSGMAEEAAFLGVTGWSVSDIKQAVRETDLASMRGAAQAILNPVTKPSR